MGQVNISLYLPLLEGDFTMTSRMSFIRLLSDKSTQIYLITECALSSSFFSTAQWRETSVIVQNVSDTQSFKYRSLCKCHFTQQWFLIEYQGNVKPKGVSKEITHSAQCMYPFILWGSVLRDFQWGYRCQGKVLVPLSQAQMYREREREPKERGQRECQTKSWAPTFATLIFPSHSGWWFVCLKNDNKPRQGVIWKAAGSC